MYNIKQLSQLQMSASWQGLQNVRWNKSRPITSFKTVSEHRYIPGYSPGIPRTFSPTCCAKADISHLCMQLWWHGSVLRPRFYARGNTSRRKMSNTRSATANCVRDSWQIGLSTPPKTRKNLLTTCFAYQKIEHVQAELCR